MLIVCEGEGHTLTSGIRASQTAVSLSREYAISRSGRRTIKCHSVNVIAIGDKDDDDSPSLPPTLSLFFGVLFSSEGEENSEVLLMLDSDEIGAAVAGIDEW